MIEARYTFPSLAIVSFVLINVAGRISLVICGIVIARVGIIARVLVGVITCIIITVSIRIISRSTLITSKIAIPIIQHKCKSTQRTFSIHIRQQAIKGQLLTQMITSKIIPNIALITLSFTEVFYTFSDFDYRLTVIRGIIGRGNDALISC